MACAWTSHLEQELCGGSGLIRASASCSGIQVARVAMLSGAERPLEVFYFVEGPGGERLPADATAAAINSVDLQRAAIILGHRVQKPVAQRESRPPAEAPTVEGHRIP